MRKMLIILSIIFFAAITGQAKHTTSSSGSGAGLSSNSVLEEHLKSVNSPSDEFCLTYESTVGDFEWQVCSAGSGDITDVGSCVTGNCGNEGGNDLFPFLFEGTPNTFETTFTVTDPTADRTFTFGNDGGQVCTDTNVLTLTNKTIGVSNTVSINASDIVDENAGTDITADLEEESHGSEHDGTGVSVSGELISTDSQEPGFIADGGATSLVCGASEQGKTQFMDDGSMEYCDGATTSVLRSGYLDADGVDDIGTDTLDDLSNNSITDLSDVSAKSGNTTTVATTSGTLNNGNCVEIDVSGNLVDSGDICGSGASGDNITVNSSAATDANFLNGDIDWTLNTGPTPDDITATVECTACISDGDAADNLTISAGTINLENSSMTGIADDEVPMGNGVDSLAYIAVPDTSASQKLLYSTGTNTFTAGTDDDVPESGDFGAAADLETTGAISSDVVDFDNINQSNTLAGNPGLAVDECFFATTVTGGGFICEGSVADTNEQFYNFPDVNNADSTQEIVTESAMQTLTNKTIDATNTVTINASDITDLNANTDITADLEEEVTEGSLANDVILEEDLKAVDAANDEDILTFEVTTGDFEWHSCAEVTGSADLCDSNDDDIPEAGDFGAATDLDANGALNTDSVSANELNAAGVEAELEAVLDLADLQEKDIDSLTGQSDIDTGFTFDGVLIDLDGGTTAEATLRLPNSASLPVNCGVGDTYWDTDADTDGSLYICRATDIWKEVDDDGGAGGGNAWTTIGTATADVAGDSMTITDSLSVDITTSNDPEDLTAAFRYDQTQAGNPALGAEECIFSTDGTGGGGLLCEGTTADTNEGLIQWNPTTDKILTLPDATDTLVGRATTDTLTNKTIDTTNTVTINASDITDLNGGTDITADLEEEGVTCTDCIDLAKLDDDAGTPSAGDLLSVRTGATDVTYTTPNAGTDITADLEEESHASEHDGTGISVSGELLSTDSTEAGFLTDGGVTSLTCGASNQGKMQVMDDGALQFCDGATTSVLADGYLDTDGVDDDVPESGDFGAAQSLDADGGLSAGSIDALGYFNSALCGTNEILEDQGGSWACIATPTGGSLPVVDTTSIAEGSADATKEVRFEVDGNTTGIVGILATAFTTAKTLTFPDATDTLVGRATTDTLTNKTIDATNTVTINASDITDLNGGTDITADLEEETHASEHESGGADQITLDGLDAGAATTRTNESKILIARHDTDCTSLTDGVAGELCYEEDADALYMCEPTAGGCDTAAEWRATSAASSPVWQDDGTTMSVINEEWWVDQIDVTTGTELQKLTDPTSGDGWLLEATGTDFASVTFGLTTDTDTLDVGFIANADNLDVEVNSVIVGNFTSGEDFQVQRDGFIGWSNSDTDAGTSATLYLSYDSGGSDFRIVNGTSQVLFAIENNATPEIRTQSDGLIGWSNSTTLASNNIAASLLSPGGNLISPSENNYFLYETDTGITASTTQTQGQGALTCEVCQVSTVANANDTVTLPNALASGMHVHIINDGANTLQIFPSSGTNLGAGLNIATTLAAGQQAVFQGYDATNWEQFNPGTGTKPDSYHGLLEAPTTSDDAILQWKADSAITITQVDCWTNTGTVTIQLDERGATTPNTAGTDIMSAQLVCDNNNQNTSSFSNAGIAEDAYISLDVDAISSPGNMKIRIEYTR